MDQTRNDRRVGHSPHLAALGLAVLAGLLPAGASAQIKAFLPHKDDVPMTEALPIDGVWTVSGINKRIRIEQGRAYAVDSWLHMLILKVHPDQVVMKDFQRQAPGYYAAEDLPLIGTAQLYLSKAGHLETTVKTGMGPVKYRLTSSELEYPAAFEQEMASVQPPAMFTQPGQGGGDGQATPPARGIPEKPAPGLGTPTPGNRPPPRLPGPPLVRMPPGTHAAPVDDLPDDCIPLNMNARGQVICAKAVSDE